MEDVFSARAIAIVGMAGRFPGAPDLDAFWSLLLSGREALEPLADEALRAAGVPEQLIADPTYVKAAMSLPDIDRFDAEFFGYSPKQAARIDPQQRMILESAWHALEDAGYCTDYLDGSVGVFAGSGTNFYLLKNVVAAIEEDEGQLFQAIIDSEKDFLVTRLSHKMGFTGPSIGVQTACSTSLVAVHLAAQSLIGFDCDVALAGGAYTPARPGTGSIHVPGGLASADGHCRAYDAGATGLVGGSGAAMVVLKRLADAIRDRDHVHAVIRATNVNNDGAERPHFTAPGLRSQAQLIETTLALAGLDATEIGMVEGHGTGTPLGDMIELTALSDVFRRPDRERYCALGSVKTNIGHLDAASGVTGLIKAALCLQHRRFVPSLNFEHPNDVLQWRHSPFFVPTAAWDRVGERPRFAGVSSLGLGGTNAHVILAEPPLRERQRSEGVRLFPISARDRAALGERARNLAAAVHGLDEDAADVAFTLQVGRKAFACRHAVVASSLDELADRLSGFRPDAVVPVADRPIAFVFPALVPDLPGSARTLWAEDAGFRDDLNRCAAAVRAVNGGDVVACLRDAQPCNGPAAAVVFAMQFALSQAWLRLGLRPDSVVVEGVGELAGSCVAGLLTLEEAAARLAGLGNGGVPVARLAELRAAGSGSRPQFLRLGNWPADAGTAGAEPVGPDAQLLYITPRAAARGAEPVSPGDLLALLGTLWSGGAAVDWTTLNHGREGRRVPLPGYPFQRERHWLDDRHRLGRPVPAPAPAPETSEAGGLFIEGVAVVPNPAPVRRAEIEGSGFVLFDAGSELAAIAAGLRRHGGRVVGVRPGERFNRAGDWFIVRPDAAEDFARLAAALAEAGIAINAAIHGWSIGAPAGSGKADPAFGVRSLAALMRGWPVDLPSPQLLVLTRGAYDVEGASPCLGAAAMAAWCAGSNDPQWCGRIADLPGDARDGDAGRYAEWIIADAVRPPCNGTVLYRGNRRLRPALVPLPIPADATAIRSIRPGGLYLLVGAPGPAVAALARALADRHFVRLALISPSASSQECAAEWQRQLADLAGDGVFVHAAHSNPGCAAALEQAIRGIKDALGPVNGLFHLSALAAGAVVGSAVDCLDAAKSIAADLGRLRDAFRRRNLDFALVLGPDAPIAEPARAAPMINAALGAVLAEDRALVATWLRLRWAAHPGGGPNAMLDTTERVLAHATAAEVVVGGTGRDGGAVTAPSASGRAPSAACAQGVRGEVVSICGRCLAPASCATQTCSPNWEAIRCWRCRWRCASRSSWGWRCRSAPSLRLRCCPRWLTTSPSYGWR